MAEVILMPRLSDTMTEGVIAAWHKNVGDTVKKGDLLAEIETDKATMELESYQEGTLLHRGATDGGKLQVNDLLAIIGASGEDVTALVAQHSGGGAAPSANKEEDPAPEPQPEVKEAPAAPVVQPQQASAPVDISQMEEVVLMPRLSDTMTEGVIAAWVKNVGDPVKKGDVLAEIETDKATMELESYKDGMLLYQGAKAGEKIQVNDLLCIIGREGLDIAPIVAAGKGGGTAAPAAQQQEAAPQQQAAAQAQVNPTAAPQQVVNEGRIVASPLAKKLAEEKGIDLRYVKGSGDNGRIVKQDVDAYQPSQAAAPAAQAQPEAAPEQAAQPTAAPQATATAPQSQAGRIGQVSFN